MAELQDEDGNRRELTFVVMAGIGLDAAMADSTSSIAKKHLGWFAYVAPIARSVILNRLFHLDYRIDGGRVRSTRAHTVIVGNCGTLTGNMLLIPAATVDDGLLDVVMMRPAGRIGWARIGTRLTLQGLARRSSLTRSLLQQAPELHSLAYVQGRRFDAHFNIPHLIELDGDSFGHITRLRVTVCAGVLRVRTPSGSTAV
ncbi:transcriptional regulator [Microbacterium sp. LjRoot45]|uniref:diacylglycerol/lipid kinase family protein n=1 Tax=Microbacterium sp. LjRoot45 TaxID=3342329 RepID=UPI003ECDC82B